MDSDFYYRRPMPLPPTTAAERDTSWKCGVCGYHLLSMDQSGRGLPLEPGPAGKILPLMCPRCRNEHVHWNPASPFDSFGDHANLPSALSARVTHGASIFDNIHKFHNEQQSAAVAAQENELLLGAPLHLSGGIAMGSGGGRDSVMPRPSSVSFRSSGGLPSSNQSAAEKLAERHSEMLRRHQLVTPTFGSQQLAKSALEYEMLADHDVLKDPDVVEALQRLRRRRGPEQAGTTTSLSESGSILLQQRSTSPDFGERLTNEQLARLPESSLQRAAAHRVTAPKALETYVCELCGRRLLRIDHEGRLIALEVDAQGNMTTIECPGCHQTHSQWIRTLLHASKSARD